MKKYNKLRGKILELYGTQQAFADKIGLTRTSVNLKLLGKTGFTKKDIVSWSKFLNIKPNQYGDYFFDD